MLRFFNRIRYKLAADNKPMKYARYAIGEIVLVVIGILIALQINNWNQSRILKRQEKILLAEINAEFKYNRTELESNQKAYDLRMIRIFQIEEFFPINLQTINLDSLALFLELTHFKGNYDYSNATLEKVKNASAAEIISNEELRNLLLKWEVVLSDFLEIEQYVIDYWQEEYLPILSKYLLRPYPEGFKDPRSELNFLTTVQFENLVKFRRQSIGELNITVESREGRDNLYELIEKIIALSGGE